MQVNENSSCKCLFEKKTYTDEGREAPFVALMWLVIKFMFYYHAFWCPYSIIVIFCYYTVMTAGTGELALHTRLQECGTGITWCHSLSGEQGWHENWSAWSSLSVNVQHIFFCCSFQSYVPLDIRVWRGYLVIKCDMISIFAQQNTRSTVSSLCQ